MKKIEFVRVKDYVSEKYNPVPASKEIPEWYKNMESYLDGDKRPYNPGQTSATIKKCIPVFDSITSGYILKTYCDLYIQHNGISYEIIASPGYQESISHHPLFQANLHESVPSDHTSIPKFINEWVIKTPKGYSCLFIPPLHRKNIIQILPGVVDTDSFHDIINFPFVITENNFTGLIPAGTPIVQIIPFKRDSWSIKNYFNPNENVSHSGLVKSLLFDGYKKLFWNRKSYK